MQSNLPRGDDRQFFVGHLLLNPEQAALFPRRHQFVEQRGGGGEADGQPFLSGGAPQAEGNVGFSSAAWAEGDHVLAPFDPVTARQFKDLHLVGFVKRLGVEAFCGREHGRLGAALNHPTRTIDQLQFDQTRQELDVVQALRSALARRCRSQITQEIEQSQRGIASTYPSTGDEIRQVQISKTGPDVPVCP